MDLETNRVGDRGAEFISKALQGTTQLQELNLRGNTIGRQGSQHLAKMLRNNTSLKRLNLQADCKIRQDDRMVMCLDRMIFQKSSCGTG